MDALAIDASIGGLKCCECYERMPVRVVGLEREPHLNGRVGTLVQFSRGSGNAFHALESTICEVKMDGDVVLVKYENLIKHTVPSPRGDYHAHCVRVRGARELDRYGQPVDPMGEPTFWTHRYYYEHPCNEPSSRVRIIYREDVLPRSPSMFSYERLLYRKLDGCVGTVPDGVRGGNRRVPVEGLPFGRELIDIRLLTPVCGDSAMDEGVAGRMTAWEVEEEQGQPCCTGKSHWMMSPGLSLVESVLECLMDRQLLRTLTPWEVRFICGHFWYQCQNRSPDVLSAQDVWRIVEHLYH